MYDLSKLHKDHHARFLLAVEEARDPDALLKTFIEAWPATIGPNLEILSAAAESYLEIQAEAAEEDVKLAQEHMEIMANFRRRIDAAHASLVLAGRNAYGGGATAGQVAAMAGVSVATVNKWVNGIRKRG